MAVKKIRAAITPPAMAVRFLKNASHIRRPGEISFLINYSLRPNSTKSSAL
jgi:hypothetical protein